MRESLIVEELLASGNLRCLELDHNVNTFAETDVIHQPEHLQESYHRLQA
jgi:hypothetical protein